VMNGNVVSELDNWRLPKVNASGFSFEGFQAIQLLTVFPSTCISK